MLVSINDEDEADKMSVPPQSLLSAIIDRYNDVVDDDAAENTIYAELDSSIDHESSRTSNSSSSSAGENSKPSIQNEVNVSFYISQSLIDSQKSSFYKNFFLKLIEYFDRASNLNLSSFS